MPLRDSPEQMREYKRRWMTDRRAAWFAGKTCASCGSTDRLELDHFDPVTKVTHVIWSWAKERREAELAKCQPLCHDCHKAKSATEKARGEQHGHSVLPADQVAEIRWRWAQGERQVDLAAEFGVDRRHIWALVHRKSRIYE